MSADKLVKGKLEAFWETGTEGVIWSVTKDGLEGYDALYCLSNGDFLRIFDESGAVIFEDEIKLEWKRNYRPYPLNPLLGQQAVNGFWVRGLQHNVVPEVWSNWFHNGLRCEFRQIEKVRTPIEIFVTFEGEDVEDVLSRTLVAFEKRVESEGAAAVESMDLKWKTLWNPETIWEGCGEGVSYDIPQRMFDRVAAVAEKHSLSPRRLVAYLFAWDCE